MSIRTSFPWRLLLLLSFGAVIGLLAAGPRGRCQSPDAEFGVLKTGPAALPSGVEPIQPAVLSSTQARTTPAPNPYPLTAEVGPWVICAAHYLGYDGFTLAQQLVLELRNKHNLGAYIYNRGDEERCKQEEEWQQYKAKFPPGTSLRRKGVRIQDQYAVLVGGFPDVAAASAFLPRIKALPLPALSLEGDKCPYERTMPFPVVDPQTKKTVYKVALVNPYHNAMVVRNPLTAVPHVNKPRWDPLWEKINSGEEYNLLKNPKRWTLVVKEYSGYQVIQAGNDASGGGTGKGLLGSLGLGSTGGESLDRAAAQAHELARFLRLPGFGGNFETWVLHTRNTSVVTVGGFDGPDDPKLLRTQQDLRKLKFSSEKTQNDPIGLLRNPILIEVPRP